MKRVGRAGDTPVRVVVIGGCGHIGSFLVPRLVRAGHEVVNVSRRKRRPYVEAAEWQRVESVTADRHAEDQAGTFAGRIADLRPDAVIDVICFTPAANAALVEALRGKVRHFVHVGTLWVHGESEIVPVSESTPRRPIGQYGTDKDAIERDLLAEAWRSGFPATAVHPGHIVGPGWACVNPQGNFNTSVFESLAGGGEVLLPNLGLECLHHVHADDVAQVIQKALDNPSQSVGEAFHTLSANAVTLLGYARAAAGWFGREPNLRFVPLEELQNRLPREDYEQTVEHISRSLCGSIEKARSLLGYQPRYTSMEACREAVEWLIAKGTIQR
jgi:nucleoside-diphosphate-sugar epimerase